MDIKDTMEYIHSTLWKGSRPGLERIRELLSMIGDPQDSLKFTHVAGTNGKGSFCAMTDSILQKSGYRVGLFTSPYIEHFNERMCVDGVMISDSELCEITEYIKPFADSMSDSPTEFELITAIGLEYFKRHGCDVVILEVGMGGRLDSTNIIKTPILSVITGIALDHTAILGDTVEKIALEKSGIIKNAPVLFGGDDMTAEKVISDTARKKNVPYYKVERDSLVIRSYRLGETVFDYSDYKDLKIKMLGSYQPSNAATVICAVKVLNSLGYCISEKTLREGLADTTWKARFEVLRNEPLTIYDGGHNIEGVIAACKSLEMYFGDKKVILLSGVMADKAYMTMAEIIAPHIQFAVTVTPDNPRSLPSCELARVYEGLGIRSFPSESVKEGVDKAFSLAKEFDLPIICLGSLYMYGDVARAVKGK